MGTTSCNTTTMQIYVGCAGSSDRHHHFDKASIATFGKILDGELPLPTHTTYWYISETL